jgi:hypothetical protein
MLTVAAIPTKYRGVQFRSRLEARWAAFFDLAGWRWQYEAFDLNGWIPDFRLCGKVPALVEVKPIDFSEFSDAEAAFKYIEGLARNVITFRDRFRKLRGYLDHEIIVLGLGPAPSQITHAGFSVPILGYMLCEHKTGLEDWAAICAGHGSHNLDYIAVNTSWRYRIGGQYDDNHDHLDFIRDSDVEYLWREASNLVQWKAPPC